MDVTQLALTWVGWPNGEKLASTCVQNLISTKVSASHRKSTQVHASPGQTKSFVEPSLQLVSTGVPVWPGLKFEIPGNSWELHVITQISMLGIPGNGKESYLRCRLEFLEISKNGLFEDEYTG